MGINSSRDPPKSTHPIVSNFMNGKMKLTVKTEIQWNMMLMVYSCTLYFLVHPRNSDICSVFVVLLEVATITCISRCIWVKLPNEDTFWEHQANQLASLTRKGFKASFDSVKRRSQNLWKTEPTCWWWVWEVILQQRWIWWMDKNYRFYIMFSNWSVICHFF